MRAPHHFLWIFPVGLLSVAACGGSDPRDFFGVPEARGGAAGYAAAGAPTTTIGKSGGAGTSGQTTGGSGGSSPAGSGGDVAATSGGSGGDTSSSGGASATGGTAATGGSGGTDATGGSGGSMNASGGSTQGSGGSTNAAGGSAGTGTMAGGSSGTAGSGMAGQSTGGLAGTSAMGGRGGGKGGSGGAPPDCDMLLQAANDALTAAQACDPGANAATCRDTVDDTCGCKVPVASADSSETTAYLAALDKLKDCPVACAALVCREPRSSYCASGSSSGPGRGMAASGQCTSNSSVTLP